jgi:D-glycero-D-manno-heptose 1,7-bisphosphate phosphatase
MPSERRPLALDPPQTQCPPARPRAAIFLDRDGVLDTAVPDPVSGWPESPLQVADVCLLPGAAAAARRLAAAGYALVCVSNQPAAAKGKATVEQLLAIHERVLELLAQDGAILDGSRLCPHHPVGVVPELSGPCPCRKPAPGMLTDAAAALALDLSASWMIGDTDADIAAGRVAGCRTMLLDYPGSAHKRTGEAGEDMLAADLTEAASLLLPGPAR